jgi:hypothetical protein
MEFTLGPVMIKLRRQEFSEQYTAEIVQPSEA